MQNITRKLTAIYLLTMTAWDAKLCFTSRHKIGTSLFLVFMALKEGQNNILMYADDTELGLCKIVLYVINS